MRKISKMILFALALILAASLLVSPLYSSVLAEEKKATTQADVKAGELSDEHMLNEELAKELVIGEEANGLNEEEREKGYKLYYPMGVKFLLPKVYEETPNAKRRTNGFESTEEDLIYMSREYYFRANAEIKLSKDLYELKDKEEQEKRMNEEVKAKDRPLFAVFVLNKEQIPESPAKMAEELGYYEFENVLEDEENGRVTYFAWGKMNEEGLEDEDLENYRKLYDAIDEVRASASFFPAAKPSESFKEVEAWDLDTVTLDGEPIDKSYFAQAKGTIAMYWVTWCPDCAHQMDEFKKIEEEAKKQNIQFLGIVSDVMEEDPDEELIKTAHEKIDASKIDPAIFTNIRNSVKMEDDLFKRCCNYPTLLFLDREGKILKAYAKPAESFAEDLLKDIEELVEHDKDTYEKAAAPAPQVPVYLPPAPPVVETPAPTSAPVVTAETETPTLDVSGDSYFDQGGYGQDNRPEVGGCNCGK